MARSAARGQARLAAEWGGRAAEAAVETITNNLLKPDQKPA